MQMRSAIWHQRPGSRPSICPGKMTLDSRMVYRKEGINMGLPSMSEFEIWRTDEKKVEEAREVLDQFTASFLNVQMNEFPEGTLSLPHIGSGT